MKQSGLTIIHAAAVRDANGIDARPGVVVVEDGVVQYAGSPEGAPAGLSEHAATIDRTQSLLLPAMVNAHTHLELTAIGPQPYDPAGGFVGWVKMLRNQAIQQASDPVEAARRGAVGSLASGVQAVGDITSSAAAAQAIAGQGLAGVCYLELFGLGPPYDQAALDQVAADTTLGLQPHAPYSAGPGLYAAASRTGKPVTTHLAETADEAAFVACADGPWLDYLQSIGRWDDAFAQHYGQGLSPVQWMRPHLEQAAHDGGWLVAHCNYVADDDIKLLADTNTSVAYCPIASAYFGHTGHRYREMLDAGVNVCLGTDSIVCAIVDDPQPLGLLSAMRRLYERDQAEPQTLLKMATRNGAKALRMDANAATLQPGAPATFACIPIDREDPADPLVQVLKGQQPAEPLSLISS